MKLPEDIRSVSVVIIGFVREKQANDYLRCSSGGLCTSLWSIQRQRRLSAV